MTGLTAVTELSRYLSVCLLTPFGACFALLLVDEWRFPLRRMLVILMGANLLDIALCLGLYWITGPTQAARIFVGTGPIVIYNLLFVFFLRYRDGRALFSIISVQLLCMQISALCSLASPFGSYLWCILWCFYVVVACLLLDRFVCVPFQKILHSAESGWGKLCVLPLTLLACLYGQYIYPVLSPGAPVFRPGVLLLCILPVLVYIALYQFLQALVAQYDTQRDMSLLRQEIHGLEQQYAQITATEEKNRIYRHDQRHFIRMLQASTEVGDLQRVQEILRRMDQDLEELGGMKELTAYTGEPLLDTVLSIGARRAGELNTELVIQVLLPGTWRVDVTEFAVVVSNALENALNACAYLPDGLPREILMTGRPVGEQLLFTIENTVCGPVCRDADTGVPLAAGSDHGYGSRSIAAFVEKYGGTLRYRQEGDRFALDLLL